MEKIKISMPCDDISESELKELVSKIDDTQINFDEGSNISGELLCGIITTAINIPILVATIASWREQKLANQKVRLVSVKDKRTIVANIRLGELATIEFEKLIEE
jgi:hypothetical protein